MSTWTPQEDAVLVQAYGSLSSDKIAQLLNRSSSTVRSRCAVLGLSGVLRAGTFQIKHGHARPGARSPEYRVWGSMIQRCNHSPDPGFSNYGGRGITVCERWLSFENFLADMGDRPSPRHSLERKNNNEGYFPANCCWATRKQQANNRRSNKWLTFNGKTQTLAQWADSVGMKYITFYVRLKAGWPIERALSEEVVTRCR